MESQRPRPAPQRKGTCAIALGPGDPCASVSDCRPDCCPPTSAARSSGFTCAGKRYCREMTSCEGAKFYLTVCGVRSLDGDGDGVPCERLCR
jgi:hypothetical protein